MKELNWMQLRDYLRGLDAEGNPFNCPFLRVLPEGVYADRRSATVYEEGALMCLKNVGSGDGHRREYCCSTNLIIRAKGLEVLCILDGRSRFQLDPNKIPVASREA